MKVTPIGTIVQCTEADEQDPGIHCYIGKEDRMGLRKAISDKRVRIENIRFFLSGNTGEGITNQEHEGKVTLVLSLGIENTAGVTSGMTNNAHMETQTTISEKIYKGN